MTRLAVIILAAGQGTRMMSKRQKILHEVGGRPMVSHVFEAAEAVSNMPPLLVIAPGEEGVADLFGEKALYAIQAEQLGTGHATSMAAEELQGHSDQVLVMYADMPLLRAETLKRLTMKQAEAGAALAMLTVLGEPDSPFGRVVRDANGSVVEIVEVANAKRHQDGEALLAIRELNVGVYCFDADWMWSHLPELPLRKARSGQEYYLTDMIGLAVGEDRPVEAIVVEDADECLGAGTREELAAVESAFRRRANTYWMANGVTLIDPGATYIDQTVTIGRDTIIWPGTYLQGESVIGDDCVLGPNTIVRDTRVGSGCRIEQSVVENAVVPDGEMVGPFGYVGGRGSGAGNR
jgi:bifunctional UDP-N-acetylglucosamine pyrophosphorylase/glucosamine-1-phosphate N-acetyltransferase